MKKRFVLAGLFFMGMLSLPAQQKYGHINSHEILIAMPEYKQMMAALDRKEKAQNQKLKNMYSDYQKRQKELTDFGAGLMEAVREEKMMELDSLEQSITISEQSGAAELQDYQAKLLKPLNDKYLKIVDQVAKENGYTYIFDLTTGVLAYHQEKTGDITGMVKKKMGITQ